MLSFEIRLTTTVQLDARCILIYQSQGEYHQAEKWCFRAPMIDYSNYLKFTPAIVDTDYDFSFELPSDAVIDEYASSIQFGFRGNNSNRFVGPNVMKEVRLSEIPGEYKSRS